MRIVLATRNPNKPREFRASWPEADFVGLDVVGIEGDAPEEEPTFAGNARSKALWTAARAPGVAVLADDSGLEVGALGGAPGVRSRRFAPEATDTANNALLLRRLQGIEDRQAAFVCALCLALPNGRIIEVEGRVDGQIGTTARGKDGFGYDPLFLPVGGHGRSMAEMSLAEKAALSHRGRAIERLRAHQDLRTS